MSCKLNIKNLDGGYISHAGGDENLLIYFMWPNVVLFDACYHKYHVWMQNVLQI